MGVANALARLRLLAKHALACGGGGARGAVAETTSEEAAGAIDSSVRSAQRNPSLFFGFERFPLKTTGFLDQLFDSLPCLFEACPASCSKGVSAFKVFERHFQGLFAFFHAFDDGFKLLLRFFKVRDFWFC